MTREELLARIEDPPRDADRLEALSREIGRYLEEHPDDLEVAEEAEVVDRMLDAIERGLI